MPRYSPLPAVSIDPRNESELVQQAAQVVYEASNKTLNDFSAGNPLAALLEGQAFAQGELLFWANQLPEKVLIEWIGPFLGAMRRLGTPATAQIRVTVSPSDSAAVFPVGTSFTTDSQLTNGQSYEFVSYKELIIPPGETQGFIPVYSKFVGTQYNVPAGSITGSSSLNLVLLEVTNPRPAVGGSNVETYTEVQERFFTLLRRRNPVSETDWQDFFEDLYGIGTLTSVQPNRTSELSYNYTTDYVLPNGQVSFFVLGPGGIELTDDQIVAGQNAINFSVPVENQGHLFPITLSQVQYDLTLEVNPNGSFGDNFRQTSLDFRNILFSILQPGTVFPATVNPTVSDVNAAFYSAFDSNTRFVDPHIVKSSAYNTPNTLAKNTATYTNLYDFVPTDFLLEVNNLIRVNNPNPKFYPVLNSYTPYSSNKYDQTVYGNLTLKQIKPLSSGSYNLGDIAYYDGIADPSQQGLHVVLENISISSQTDILSSIASGKISPVKTYTPWITGTSYQYSAFGTIDPQIVAYDYREGEFIPAFPETVPLENRVGGLAWLVSKNFTLENPTNDITGAQANFNVGGEITPDFLVVGNSYNAGTWVCTPQVASGPDTVADPYYNYVDTVKGAVIKYAYVISTFTYNPNSQKISDYFDSLVDQEFVKEIIVFDGNGGLPIYKYKPRFKAGQYLEFRESVLSEPKYLIASQFFTPSSTNLQDLLDSGDVIEIAPTPELKSQLTRQLDTGLSGKIEKLSISDGGQGYSDGTYVGVPLSGGDGSMATVNLLILSGVVISAEINNAGMMYREDDILTVNNSYLGGSGSDLVLQVVRISSPTDNPLLRVVRMFSFFRGDTTFFRNKDRVQSYTAQSSVSPLFEFEIYYNNKIFLESSETDIERAYDGSIPYYNPSYLENCEDVILSEDGKNFYRVMRAFTPSLNTNGWNGSTQKNSPRYEEYEGNLLRIVTMYECEEPILPQFGKETSSIKLGSCKITLIPKNSATFRGSNSQQLSFVWESTESITQVPELSWFTSSNYPYQPPNYRTGTLSL